jgi:hypothetical protein
MNLFAMLYGMSMPGGGTLEVSPSAAFLCLGVAAICLGAGVYWANRRREWLQHSAVAHTPATTSAVSTRFISRK